MLTDASGASVLDDVAPVILVGYSKAWLNALARYEPNRSVVFVDEPDVIRKRGVRADVADSATLRELIEWEYQLDGAADCFFHRYPDLRPSAVIPVVEYSVPFAARLAERYGVVGATYGAALLLRDKYLLRKVTAAAGIPNPESVEVGGPDEVRAFMARVGGPVVLKPANRQASVGTKIVSDPADVDAAWDGCVDQDEGSFVPDRPMPLRMLAERYLRGDEFSVEMMVHRGEPIFSGVTRKFLFDGPYPVECGHLHPADVEPELAGRLVADTARVADAVGVDTGWVHCEWIVEDGVPHVVECAGRLPGGGVMDIVCLAWQYDAFGHYLAMMKGERPDAPPVAPPRHAAARLSQAPAGEVLSVDGVDEARAVPGVHSCSVRVAPGERIGGLRSSWDRVAMVMADGATAAEAMANAQKAIDLVVVTVRPVGAA